MRDFVVKFPALAIKQSSYERLLNASGGKLAERGGFEPPVRLLTVQRFSKPPPSATRPSLLTRRMFRSKRLAHNGNGSSRKDNCARAEASKIRESGKENGGESGRQHLN